MLTQLLPFTLLASLLSLTPSALASPLDARQFISTDPNDDAFYHPTNLNAYHNGQIINNRTVTTLVNAPGSLSWQLSFRTTGNSGEANSSVATVWAPAFPVLSPPRILAYQFAEDGDNLDCAPSYSYVSINSKAQVFEKLLSPLVIEWALNQGYYVVVTDAEGPAAAWLVGNIEGHAVLDAIRATIAQFGLDPVNTRIGMIGYSGGAHTTVWASTLKQTYAPTLNIVGAAFGGTPIDLNASFAMLNGKSQSLLVAGALFGLANAYRNLDASINNLLTPAGIIIRNNLRARGNCTQMSNTSLDYNTILKNDNINAIPGLAAVFAQETLLKGPSTPVPPFPRLQYHGTTDTTVPFAPEQAYVTQQCQSSPSSKLFFTPFQNDDHPTTALLGVPGALSFIQNTLNGGTPTGACGSSTWSFPPPGSSGSISILGSNIDQKLQILAGMQFTG